VKGLATIKTNSFILYFGYFHRRKGLADLVNAFTLVAEKEPKLKLVLAGGCLQQDFEDQIKRLVKKAQLGKKVIFTGFVEEPQLRWLLDHCLLVAQPLTYSISASGPLAQAIAHHKPIVTTDMGVSSGEIEDGVTGLLVEPNKPDQLAKAILKIVKSKEMREKMRKNLKKMQEERDWQKIATSTRRVYQSAQ
jgi:rhamnosyl/mannosyltransferase